MDNIGLTKLIKLRNEWLFTEFNCAATKLPMSFILDGIEVNGLFENWDFVRTDTGNGFEIIARKPEIGLKITCSGKIYDNFPVVEWVFKLKNEGVVDTPLLEHIKAVDLRLDRTSAEEFILRTNKGDTCTASAYEPIEKQIGFGDTQRFSPVGGRPTNMAYPFFNLGWDDCGVLMSIGWPGQWAAQFYGDRPKSIHMTAGQEITKLKLQPGEEIRTPLIALMFRGKDFMASQNQWRSWMVKHNMPKQHGKHVEPFNSACHGIPLTAEIEMKITDHMRNNGIVMDYLWTDAGWYEGGGQDWTNIGTWEADKIRYPSTYREVSDYVDAYGIKTVLWFESERVSPGSELAKHTKWLLQLKNDHKSFRPEMDLDMMFEDGLFSNLEALRNQVNDGDMLFNLGIEEAREFLTELIAGRIEEYNIGCYRTDFNINPLEFWRGADVAERQGITEIKYVEGFLKFWDELQRRFPDVVFDTCASGGRRTDLETLRRALPLLRSDFQATSKAATGNQGHTYGMSMWVPYGGTGTHYTDTYGLRSHLSPFMGIGCDFNLKDIENTVVDWDKWKNGIEDWKTIKNYFLGDYYPLSSYNVSEEKWLAWQFDRPDLNGGMVQAFRRMKCLDSSTIYRLCGLVSEAEYQVKDLDQESSFTMSGFALMEEGFSIHLPEPRSAAIFVYKELPRGIY